MKILLLLLLPLWGYGQIGETRENVLLSFNNTGYTISEHRDCIVQEYRTRIVLYNFERDTCTSIIIIGSPENPGFCTWYIERLVACVPYYSGFSIDRDCIIYKIQTTEIRYHDQVLVGN